MNTEVIDFPRGGTLKSLFRTSQQQHHEINEFDGDGGDIAPITRKSKRTLSVDKPDGIKKSKIDAVEDIYAAVFRQTVSPELLAQNLRSLAFVKFIGELEVILECVDGIQLNLPIDKISRMFTSQVAFSKSILEHIFHKGQAFAFKALKNNGTTGKWKRIHCTITTCPYEVNSHLIPSILLPGTVLNGIVTSIEEKGAIIDLGFSASSARGFVQSEELPQYLQLKSLRIGQVAMFRVKEKPTATTRVIKLSGFLEMDTLDENTKLDGNGKALMPGTIVQVHPEKSVFDGVFVSIKNGPTAYIRKVHLPPRLRFDPKPIAKPFRACILCSQPNSPLLVLSAHPDIIALSKIEKRHLPPEIKIGAHIDCIVYHVDKKQNVYFKLDDDNDRQTITAKCLRVNIDNIEENLPHFSIGSEHRCRILGYSSTERQLFVSTREADLNKKVVSVEDALPGTKLKGTIKRVGQNGLVVEFGDGMSGFVGAMHVLDRPAKNWQKRFQKDQRILCRVLFADVASNRLMLTAKPSMVKTSGTEKLVTSFDKQLEGAISNGVIIKHLEGGSLLVAFFNKIAGILSQRKARLLPPEAAQIGASIKVLVQYVNQTAGHMALDLPSGEFVNKPNVNMPRVEGPSTALGMEEREGRKKEALLKERTKLVDHAKPLRIYTAKVVGPWPYGGTSAETTAELLLPGGSVGRLHVSELNNLREFEEGSRPMQHFLSRNAGKMINVKVLSVSRNNTIPKKGWELVMESRQSDRIVECTAREDKLQETRRKLSLLNYKSDFNCGTLTPVFIVAPTSTEKSQKGLPGEINPDFHAFIPREQIKIPSVLRKIEELGMDCEELFDTGELRFGRVVGVNKTKRGKVVQLELVERTSEEEELTFEYDTKKKRRNTLSESEKGIGEKAEQSEGEVLEEEMAEGAEGGGEEETEEDEEEAEEGEKRLVDTELLGEALASADEYERVILTHPNSVPHWIGFIQFYLSRARASAKKRYELGKAVAERALKTIVFQNDSDLDTIWKAYLNLEVLLGTEESLNECFKRACASSKSLEMHKYLIRLLKQQPNAEGREEEICGYFESMVKKFRKTDLEPWFAYSKHLLQRGEAEESHQLLRRALQCTEKRKHLTILNKFTQLEERFGDKERAKTMEELVKSYKEGGKQMLLGDRWLEQAIGKRREDFS